MSTPTPTTYSCGPVRLVVTYGDPAWGAALAGLLTQYDAPWPAPEVQLQVTLEHLPKPRLTPAPQGRYLHTYRLHVDRLGERLVSLSEQGVEMEYDPAAGRAWMGIPAGTDRPALLEEIEQQFVLLLARAWAARGWTPVHAATVLPPGEAARCLLIGAPSGTGKTTLVAALLQRGWRTLGDDKILLRRENGAVQARALAQRFHLHPWASRWFPEAGDITTCPRYSRWTEKRVVRIETIWPGRLREQAVPGAIVRLERSDIPQAVQVTRLGDTDALGALLRQVVIPQDAAHARPLVACLAAAAAAMRAARLDLGQNVYSAPEAVARLDRELRELLA